MTAQIPEILAYEGRSLSMFSTPLSDYLAQHREIPPFEMDCTALWRGYQGTWALQDQRLMLVELQGNLSDGRRATLATLFPGHEGPVFAEWYSGTLCVPQGRQLKYVHMGFSSQYEQYLLLNIEQGRLVDVQTSTSAPTSPDVDDEDIPSFLRKQLD